MTAQLREVNEIVLRGGIPGGVTFASAGDAQWHREPGETETAFLGRVRLAAFTAAAAGYVIFSSMPPESTVSANDRIEQHLAEHRRLTGGTARADAQAERPEPLTHGGSSAAEMEKFTDTRKGKNR